MLRKVLGVLASVGAAAAAPAETRLNPDKIMPYVVSATYLEFQKGETKQLSWPLGHGLHVVLVHDLNGIVGNVTMADLKVLGLSPEDAKRRAIANLDLVATSGAIGQRRFVGPDQKPFVLFGGHWAAAACILLPKLFQIGTNNLQSQEICVCIPHREALLMFPKATSEYREVMLKMIKARESSGTKPLTFQLFEITSAGISELK